MSQIFALVRTGALTSVYQMTQSKNPVHCVFYLVLLFLHRSGLLVQLGLEYFVLLQLLVYVGRLRIQFQFVVMLLDVPATEIQAHQRGSYPVAGILRLCILVCAFLRLYSPFSRRLYTRSPSTLSVSGFVDSLSSGAANREKPFNMWRNRGPATSPVANQGIRQYGVHPDLLIIASLLLLVAMVGAVGLTLKRPVAAPDYDVFRQHSVDFQKGLVQIKKSYFILLYK